jgi:putative FmdB family regulatory protein
VPVQTPNFDLKRQIGIIKKDSFPGKVVNMPIYEYEAASPGRKCRKCSSVFEVIQRISDPPLTTCPECHKEIWRRISRARVILPGSARGRDEVEQKVADYERQGMYSHAAELADKESEKPEKARLKERAMEDYKKAGYNF